MIYGQLMLLMQSVLFYRVLYRLPSDQTSCDFLPTGVGRELMARQHVIEAPPAFIYGAFDFARLASVSKQPW